MGNNEIEIRKDCFGYQEKGGFPSCTALKELYCKKEECVFYKHKSNRSGKGMGQDAASGRC
ncbi:MAG: hypothetical protein K2N87_18420 [Eubacterium sp.]|nr:hypothetical protein [Eubacterium sp.]